MVEQSVCNYRHRIK